MDQWLVYLILFAVGVIAGTLNTIAGGGSFLTLPALMATSIAGLEANVANGTNRVAIVIQNIGAVWGFHRHGVVDWRYVAWAALPASCGAGLGAWIANLIGDAAFKSILAFLMVGVTLWTLWDPLKKRKPAAEGSRPNVGLLALGFFVVGIYGGFVQAGVGFLILAATTMAGLDLVRGNAVKVLSILVYSFVALGVFANFGNVDWVLGLALAAGNFTGSQIGVRLTVLKGHAWVKAVVTIAVIALAIKLLVVG